MSDDVKLASKRIHTGRVINLDIDTVRFPDGTTGEMEMIRHSGASAVIPFLSAPEGDDPQILLIRQYRYAAGGFIYEIPAGRLESGEAPEACARRELLEETGCSAEILSPLIPFLTTPGFTDERIHLFMASGLTRGETKREADEFMELAPMPMSRVLELIESGAIEDAKTIIALLFVAGFRLGR